MEAKLADPCFVQLSCARRLFKLDTRSAVCSPLTPITRFPFRLGIFDRPSPKSLLSVRQRDHQRITQWTAADLARRSRLSSGRDRAREHGLVPAAATLRLPHQSVLARPKNDRCSVDAGQLLLTLAPVFLAGGRLRLSNCSSVVRRVSLLARRFDEAFEESFGYRTARQNSSNEVTL